ncbi:MAG: hypothetical protein K8R35_05900 [Bacteroidales bacterium]|nr:hypothetical protein [Bacteroidales bacterium]
MDDIKYNKVKEKLKRFIPTLQNEADLVSSIIKLTDDRRSVSILDSVIDIFFGWTNLLWVRRGFAVISLFIVFLFLFQQVKIIHRINSLEGRIVGGSTQNIIEYQQHKVKINSLQYNNGPGSLLNDSIVVADRDLRDLINSYTELQKKYEDLQKQVRLSLTRGKTNL